MTCPFKYQVYNGLQPIPSGIEPVENRPGCSKPFKGFWTSTLDLKYGSDWIQWMHGENWYTTAVTELWMLTVKPDGKIFTVNGIDDMELMFRTYPLHTYGIDSVNFEKMATHYDGVHLTHEGNRATHHTFPHNCNAWDAESTLWFRWCFDSTVKMDKTRDDFE
jgi:hypothetical protein